MLDTIKKQAEWFAGKYIWVSQKSSSPGQVRWMHSAPWMHCVLAVVSIETTSPSVKLSAGTWHVSLNLLGTEGAA